MIMNKKSIAIAIIIASAFIMPAIFPSVNATNFTGNYSDRGEDTNTNGYLDYLIVTMEINVTFEDDYRIDGDVWANNGTTHITFSQDYVHLTEGIWDVEQKYSGRDIYDSGKDGPYEVRLSIYYYENNTNSWVVLDADTYSTYAYQYTQFERPPSGFTGEYDDYGEDTDNDTYYNFLVVYAVVNITMEADEDNYTLNGTLVDENSITVDEKSNTTYLNLGEHAIYLFFIGYTIREHAYNGTYTVYFALNKGGNKVDDATHTTIFYFYTQFEIPGANFTGNYGDIGQDTNGNSYYDFLSVNIEIEVYEEGTYIIKGYLYSSGELITNNSESYSLGEGTITIPFRFEGIEIYNSQKDGYDFKFELCDNDGIKMDDLEFSSAYLYTAFERPGADYIEGSETYTAEDEDNDTYYDYLLINITFDIQTESDYRLEGELRNGANTTTIATNSTTIRLPTGAQIITLRFEGEDIYNSNEDSPYIVIWKLYQISGTRGDVEIQNGSFEVSGYTHEEFVPEFSTLLIPMFATICIFVLARRRKK